MSDLCSVHHHFLGIFLVNFVEHIDQSCFLVFRELLGELDVEFKDQVTPSIALFDRSQRVVVQDWHTFTRDHLKVPWANNLIDAYFDLLAFKCLE